MGYQAGSTRSVLALFRGVPIGRRKPVATRVVRLRRAFVLDRRALDTKSSIRRISLCVEIAKRASVAPVS